MKDCTDSCGCSMCEPYCSRCNVSLNRTDRRAWDQESPPLCGECAVDVAVDRLDAANKALEASLVNGVMP
jgi:hypothetical protein